MTRIGLAFAFVLALGLGPAADAQQSVSGKYVAALDGEFDPPSGCIQDVPIGTLAKGIRGGIVTVHITASRIEIGTVPRIQQPRVNGREMVGPSAIDGPPESQYGAAAVSGVWWLDLDEAEAAEPGAFVGRPLVVE